MGSTKLENIFSTIALTSTSGRLSLSLVYPSRSRNRMVTSFLSFFWVNSSGCLSTMWRTDPGTKGARLASFRLIRIFSRVISHCRLALKMILPKLFAKSRIRKKSRRVYRVIGWITTLMAARTRSSTKTGMAYSDPTATIELSMRSTGSLWGTTTAFLSLIAFCTAGRSRLQD